MTLRDYVWLRSNSGSRSRSGPVNGAIGALSFVLVISMVGSFDGAFRPTVCCRLSFFIDLSVSVPKVRTYGTEDVEIEPVQMRCTPGHTLLCKQYKLSIGLHIEERMHSCTKVYEWRPAQHIKARIYPFSKFENSILPYNLDCFMQ
jgi:hypothetical protein